MIITDVAVFGSPNHSRPFHLIELAPGVTSEEVAAKTTAHYVVCEKKYGARITANRKCR